MTAFYCLLGAIVLVAIFSFALVWWILTRTRV